MRRLGFILFIALLSNSVFAQISEDFDHDDQSVSESNCWEFDGVGISKPPSSSALNPGNKRPLGDVPFSNFGTSELISPFGYFDGSNTINFDHRLTSESGSSIWLTVYLEDPSGTRTQVFSHYYRLLSYSVNGDPSNNQAATISTTFTGYARVVFEWSYIFASNSGYIDEIEIDADNAANSDDESNGYCPAIMTVNDTVCAGDLNVNYEALYADATHTYTWSFSGSSAGTLDQTITTNNQSIELDFDTVNGSFQLIAVESTSGHQTVFNIYVNDLPSLSYTVDSICLEEPYDIELTLTGQGPWELEYEYTGSGSKTVTISSSPYTLSLPAEADTFEFIGLSDDNGCEIDQRFLPSVTVPYYPKPGPITVVPID